MFGSHRGCEAASPSPRSITSLFLAAGVFTCFFVFSKMGQEVMPATLCVNHSEAAVGIFSVFEPPFDASLCRV